MIGAYIRIRDKDGNPWMRGEALMDIKKGTLLSIRKCERGGLYDGPEGSYVLVVVDDRKIRTERQTVLAFVD